MFVSDILKGKAEGKVELKGWVRNLRSSGGIVFILLRDGTGVIQCVGKRDRLENFDRLERLGIESAIHVKGIVRRDERAPGGYEVEIEEASIIHETNEYPISKKEHGVEFLLDNRHLAIRSPRYSAIWRVKDAVLRHVRDFFHSKRFIEVTPPIIVSGACEGGSTLFEFKYFDSKAYLSQSAQLYLEAMIYSYPLVFSITPSFRAEKSRTRRHLAEYWHIEPEMAFYDHGMNMQLQEELVEHVVQGLLDEMQDELKLLGRNPEELENVKKPFHKMSYDKAVEELQSRGFEIEWGDDLGTDEERELTRELDKPLLVERYPKEVKAFYMKLSGDGKTVLNNDMLAPEGYGEIIGGSEREDRLEYLLKRIRDEGLDEKEYGWYIDLRKYGSVPHSGFGLGLERLLRWILKLDHIRDATPFPRTINRSYP